MAFMAFLFLFFIFYALQGFKVKFQTSKTKNLQHCGVTSEATFIVNHMVDRNHSGIVNSEKSCSFEINLCEFEIALNLVQEPCHK